MFIAVLTEAFAEFRVQFNEMWQSGDGRTEESLTQRLEKAPQGWRLVAVDAHHRTAATPRRLQSLVSSTGFQLAALLLVLINALFNASFVYKHDRSDEVRKRIYYYVEVRKEQ